MIKAKTAKELWAAVTDSGEIAWSRGGSSSPQRLMVFDSAARAESAINNSWTRQVYKRGELHVEKIYPDSKKESSK